MTSNKLLSLILLLFVFSTVTFGEFMLPIAAPVDRLIKNTTAYINENPDDINAYYTLGRIHYLAFANKSRLVGAYEYEALPSIPQDWMQEATISQNLYNHARELVLKEYGYSPNSNIPNDKRTEFHNAVQKKREELKLQNWNPGKIENEEIYEHANEAMKLFNKVIEMDPENGLYYHGLACLIEQYAKYLDEIKSEVVPELFRSVFLEQAKQYYYKSFSLSIKEDSTREYKPMEGLKTLISFEAGNSYIRLCGEDLKNLLVQKNMK